MCFFESTVSHSQLNKIPQNAHNFNGLNRLLQRNGWQVYVSCYIFNITSRASRVASIALRALLASPITYCNGTRLSSKGW